MGKEKGHVNVVVIGESLSALGRRIEHGWPLTSILARPSRARATAL